MASLGVKVARVEVESSGYGATDVTESVRKLVADLGLERGVVTIYSVDRDCFVLGIEYEPNLLADLESFMKSLGCLDRASPCIALLSKPISVAVVRSQLLTGSFRRIVLVDVSREPRPKSLVIALEGVFRGS